VVCHGAQPLFFLDYVAVGKVVPERIAEIVSGVAEGCAEAGCSLVGGETAEHPGTMEPDAFDLAGFCVGIVERDRLLDGSTAREGDAIIGIESSGLHSNGYSLVRRLIAEHRLDLDASWESLMPADPQSDLTLGDVLLAPTRIYARDVLALRDDLDARGLRLSGMAHITGGGLAGNLPRAVPESLGVRFWDETDRHGVFRFLQELSGLSNGEMRATFNCGVGMALVAEPAAVEHAIDFLRRRQLQAWQIGEVIPASEAGPGRYVEVGT
jgi:phosphoribosylformylglycinamidine cyclo-ligase